ncbi:MAG: DUF4367 domain-containing protein [Clostridiales bacterium]|nr:DUF4367 domain-containing protein [Clostridiales bacterium]
MNNFEKACWLSNKDWVDSLDDSIEYEFSKSHNRKMNRLFSKMRNNKYHRFTRATARALIIAAIIMAISVTAFAIPATREYILNKFKEYSSYSVNTDSQEKVDDLSVGYLPEGYKLVSEEKYEMMYIRQYSNPNVRTNLSVKKYYQNGEINFDTENYEKEILNFNGIDYIIYKNSNGYYGAIWNNSICVFNIDGCSSKEEAINMAKSTK